MSRTQYFTTAFFIIALQQLVFSAYADSEHSSPTHHTHKAIEITWKEVNELGCTFIDYINTTPIVTHPPHPSQDRKTAIREWLAQETSRMGGNAFVFGYNDVRAYRCALIS